ncbi:MAG: SPFH domain-containing protein [Armatimonadota bacterium]|nr:SPFH domain-containing protein [Armatimonadota bacterium]MDR7443983.1 SPFH domain-containing protein [Armatimonadota bacterium]MDR7570081.1 SPFH domain-containing protein [Armatimonadota bacterium]MDR7615414.1 SPFH domain-containing protein [Armatimonadota bacterium]
MWWVVVAAAIVAAAVVWAVRYTKVGPNEVLIISGRRRTVTGPDGRRRVVGYRLVHGGGTFVWPIKEKVQRMSLELMTLEVRTPEVYTVNAIPVTVDGVAQVKIRGDEDSIAIAAEQFLSRSREDVMRTVLQTLEGHMRAVLGTMTVEDIYRGRQELARRVREAASEDLHKMGMEIVSLTIRNVTDTQGYLEALARPRIAQVKRDAVKGEAEAEKEAQQARFQAETAIAQAQRDMELKKAEYEAEVKAKRAEADLSYDLHRYRIAQQVKAEEIQVGIVEREKLVELEEREVARKEKELLATVLKPAQVERQRTEVLAEAERYRLEAEGLGRAEEIKARGAAEAEVIRLKGLAEAEAMRRKAESWSQYNEAAVIELIVRVLPELARAVSEPLAKTERIVVVNADAAGSGVSRVPADVARVVAQLPTLVESLTGVKLEQLLERIPNLRDRPDRSPESAPTAPQP